MSGIAGIAGITGGEVALSTPHTGLELLPGGGAEWGKARVAVATLGAAPCLLAGMARVAGATLGAAPCLLAWLVLLAQPSRGDLEAATALGDGLRAATGVAA